MHYKIIIDNIICTVRMYVCSSVLFYFLFHVYVSVHDIACPCCCNCRAAKLGITTIRCFGWSLALCLLIYLFILSWSVSLSGKLFISWQFVDLEWVLLFFMLISLSLLLLFLSSLLLLLLSSSLLIIIIIIILLSLLLLLWSSSSLLSSLLLLLLIWLSKLLLLWLLC